MRNFVYNTLKIFSPVVNTLLKNRLRVLAYHDIVDPVNFEAQLLWLKSRYSIIDVSTLKEHLFHHAELPPKPLLITLDDGDKSVFTRGLPIFKKLQIPACLFIITDLVNSNKDFWWNTIIKNEKKRGLSKTEIIRIINEKKSIPNQERIKLLNQYPATHQEQLTVDELDKLEKNNICIANHSHTHPMFDQLQKQELVEELEQVRLFFEQNRLGDYSVFAYPNGNLSEYTETLLRENDIKIAFLFDHKINKKEINPLRISRIAVDSDNPMAEFATKVSGLHPTIHKIQKQL